MSRRRIQCSHETNASLMAPRHHHIAAVSQEHRIIYSSISAAVVLLDVSKRELLRMSNANSSSTSTGKRRRVEDLDNNNDDAVWADFHELAHRYPEFARAWTTVKEQKNMSLAAPASPEFQVALTRALLHLRFELHMPSLPDDRLCPPVPNRWAYVRWIQRTLLPMIHTRDRHFETILPPVYRGLDIGTGASCIYSLLYVKTQPDAWTMVGTEVDPISAESSRTNVRANQLESKIQVVDVPPTRIQCNEIADRGTHTSAIGDSDGPISCALQRSTIAATRSPQGGPCFDFCMTNPPFFDTAEAVRPRADDRDRSPMTSFEGTYPGGEEGFVIDMIRDSVKLRDRIGWYSAMCGKKTSFVRLRQTLIHLLGPGHVHTMQFGPGHMTRWFLAWTYRRPRMRSPAAEVDGDNFEVRLDGVADTRITEEVVNRILAYCDSLPGWELTCQVNGRFDGGASIRICETVVLSVERYVDEPEPLPARLLDGVEPWEATQLLPTEGHFCIDIVVAPKRAGLQDTVLATMTCFRHSARGGFAVEKIRSQLKGEVCRTNRRWRRILKRQADVSTQAMEVE